MRLLGGQDALLGHSGLHCRGASALRGVSEPVAALCATNRDLKREVEEGRFRDDLYYRLNVVEVHNCAPSGTPGGYPGLAEHFVRHYNMELSGSCPDLADRAMLAMMSYPWPGNVRELENVIERGIIFSDGHPIDLQHLPFSTDSDAPAVDAQS